MNRKEQIIGWTDIARGLAELAAETAIGGLRAVLRMPRQFATHGDHLFEHPLDQPTEPVTDMPNRWENVLEQSRNTYDDMGDYTERSE